MSTAKQDADTAKEAWDIVSEAAHEFSVAGGTQEERDEIAGALKFLRHRFRPGQVCVWHEDADGNWWTNCRHGWVFSEGGPYDNLMQYCCYCGRPLDEQAETHNPAIDGCAKVCDELAEENEAAVNGDAAAGAREAGDRIRALDERTEK